MPIANMHWPPMNKFACKLHGYIVYFIIHFTLFSSDRLNQNKKKSGNRPTCTKKKLNQFITVLFNEMCTQV